MKFTTCEDPAPEPEGPAITVGPSSTEKVFTLSADPVLFVTVDPTERKPEPTTEELFARAADTSLPLAHRLSAAERVAWMLRQTLEQRCEALFPDFYWESSERGSTFMLDNTAHAEVQFPLAKKWRNLADDDVTPERDQALRDLGFVYLNGKRLGLTGADR